MKNILNKSAKQSVAKGFTIVEVVLVLAMTGFIFLIIVVTIRGRVASAQFVESVRDIEAYLELQYSELSSGIADGNLNNCTAGSSNLVFNANPTNNVGSGGECINMGKVLFLYADKIAVDTLAGRRLDSGDLNGTDIELISTATPSTFPGTANQQDKEFRWDVKLKQFDNPAPALLNRSVTSTSTPTAAIGFIRSPQSSKVLIYTYRSLSAVDVVGASSNFYSSTNDTGTHVYASELVDADLCFSDGTRNARINVGNGNDSKNFEVEFDGGAC